MIIGIDLGTTNSVAACMAEDGPRLIPNALGEVLTPSVVGIDAEGRLLIGRAAKQLQVTHPDRCASLFKRQEISRLQTVKVAQFDALARFDLLRDLSINFHRMTNASHVPQELRELVARSWTASPWELQGETIRILAPLARQPNQLLVHFDGLHSLCPGLLAQLGGLLNHAAAMRRGTDADWPAEVLDQLVRDVVDKLDWQDYPQFRSKLVQFCVEELVSPDLAAQTLQAHDSYWIGSDKHLAQAILNDWPLRYVYEAHRLLIG